MPCSFEAQYVSRMPTKPPKISHDLHARAEQALETARSLPYGPEKVEALKKALRFCAMGHIPCWLRDTRRWFKLGNANSPASRVLSTIVTQHKMGIWLARIRNCSQ